MAIPALWKVNVDPLHPFVTCYEIDVTPVQSVPDMKITARIWRRCVYTERSTRLVMRIEPVNVVLSPILPPLESSGTRTKVFPYGEVRPEARASLERIPCCRGKEARPIRALRP